MKKAVKIPLKILGYIVGITLALIILITIILKLSENKITDFALTKVSEIIKAPVSINDVNFKLLRKFPHATVEFNQVCLGEEDSLSEGIANKDSLLFINKIYVSVNTRSLISGKYKIEDIELSGLTLNYFVTEKGESNFDFLIPPTDTTLKEEPDTLPAILDVVLGNLTLSDITLNYRDSNMHAGAKLQIPQLNITGSIYDTIYTGKVNGDVILTNCNYEDYNVNLMEKTQLSFNIGYEYDSISLTNIKLKTDGLDLGLQGKVALSDSIFMDLGLNLPKIDLGELIKYAPDTLLQQYGVEEVKGTLSINSTIKGYYKDSTLLPQVDANIKMKNGKVITKDYPALQTLNIDGFVSNGHLKNNSTTSADFKNIEIKTNKSTVNIACKVKNIDKPEYWIKSDMFINTDEFANFIPDSTVQYLKGNVKLAFETKGTLPNDIGINSADYFLDRTKLNLELDKICTAVDNEQKIDNLCLKFSYRPNRQINLSGLSLKAPAYNMAVKNSHIKAKILGSPSNIDNMGADIQSFNLAFGESYLKGKAYMKNTKKPDFKLDTELKLQLAELKPFIHDTLVKQLAGLVNVKINSYGTVDLDSISDQAMPIAFEQTKLSVDIQDVTVKEAMQNDQMNIDNFAMNINLADDTLHINKLFVDVLDTKLDMDSTEIWNLYKTYFQERRDTQLIVQTNINIDSINYDKIDKFLQSMSDEEEEKTEQAQNETQENTDTIPSNSNEQKYLLPDLSQFGLPQFIIRGNLAVGYIKYEKNIIDNLSTKFRFSDSLYVLDDFKLTTCGGDVQTSLMLDARNWKKPKADIKNYISNVNLKQVLINNDNFEKFGNTSITYEKVSGILTSEFHGRVFFDGDSLVQEKIRAKGHFKLENGKLYNYTPLAELSKQMRMFGGLDELNKLDFSTLETSLFLYNNKVFIPKTNVITSSLDFTAFAMQGLTEKMYYEYHLVLHMKDILAGKSKKLLEEQKKQTKKQKNKASDDRNGLDLVALSLENKTKYGFDNKKLKFKFKNDLNIQEGFLNLVFFPSLVNFSTALDRSQYAKDMTKKYNDKKNK